MKDLSTEASSRAVPGTIDLDEQIAATERALIAGRQRISIGLDQVRVGVRAQACRNFGIGLAIVVGALFIARWRRPPRDVGGARLALPVRERSALVKALPMVGQLLPGALRRRLPNLVSSVLFGLLWPTLGRLLQRAKPPATQEIANPRH